MSSSELKTSRTGEQHAVRRLLPFKTLRGLFSAAMMLLLLISGVAGFLLFMSIWESRLEEHLQIINWGVARELAIDLEPILLHPDGVDIVRLYDAAERYRRINELMKVYLLDGTGKVVVDFSGAAVNFQVPRKLIDSFLDVNARERLPLLGPDPSKPRELAPFVAAPVNFDPGPGFVYVLLENDSMRAFSTLFFRDASFQALVLGCVLSFLVLGSLAYLISWAVTSRFNTVTAALQRYRAGDLSARVAIAGDDELGRVAAAINSMADSIQDNIAQLLTKDALRRELILNVWHDLRSPITSLRAHVELLEINERSAAAGKRLEFYRIIFRNIDQLSQLLTELHELARLETKDHVPSFEQCDLAALGSEILAGFRERPEAAGRSILLQAEEALPLVVCDPRMITRVLVNLLENALRYTPEGGSITIAMKRQGSAIRVEVSDTGMGIPQEALPHLFERWFQVDTGAGRPIGSSGLGLAIVRKMIEAHNSSIAVESEEGKGATFWFLLAAAGGAAH